MSEHTLTLESTTMSYSQQSRQEIPLSLIEGTKNLLKRHLVDPVIAAAAFGAHSRGYADISADKDIVCLVRRRNSTYLSLDAYLHKEQTKEQLEEARSAEITMISRSISEELGENISITLIDERALLLGILRGVPSRIGAMHSLAANSKYVAENYLSVYNKYFDARYAALRYIDAAKLQIERLAQTTVTQLYRQERNYLTALWSIMRALEYRNAEVLGKPHAGLISFKDLMQKVSKDSHLFSEINLNILFDPYYRRIEREHMDNVLRIDEEEEKYLKQFYVKALGIITESVFGENYKPCNDTIAKEMLVILNRNQAYFDLLENNE